MKKILLFIMLLVCTTVSAETYSYRSFQFAYKAKNSYGIWTDWTDWEKSNLLITIDFTSDVVTIYSSSKQVYNITDSDGNYTDSSGGQQMQFRFIDQDGDRGIIRFRIEKNKNSQIYIEFADVIWVYNVRLIR